MGVDEKNNQKQKKFMKCIYKKIIFIISAIALLSVIVGVVKYSLIYIENNPKKYLPTQSKKKIEYKFTSKNLKSVLNMIYIDSLSHENQKHFSS